MGDAHSPPPCSVIRSINPNYIGYDYIGWYVGNARQTVSYFVNHYGFAVLAYRGPETGSYATASYVVGNGTARFLFTSPLRSPDGSDGDTRVSDDERRLCADIHAHLTKHGDGVKDIAFTVDDVRGVWQHAVDNGAEPVQEPTVLKDDDGEILLASIRTFGDTIHTLVNRSAYQGAFLPGYTQTPQRSDSSHESLSLLPHIDVVEIDHCVGNQPWNGLEGAVRYYEKALNFHRFWTVDDSEMCSEFSAMNSVVVASPNEVIKMPMNEPAAGKKKSQIEEFCDYYNGSGCQHIALRTPNIITAVHNLRQCGVDFLSVPETYYADVRARLQRAGTNVAEDIDTLQRYNILIDFDEGGYLLQIFTKHVGDRPTVFLEIIQRENFEGFGAGNFRSLFEAFEREQALRGNL
ncbi:4-hydroxyphenylpyruvate dioxygenase 2 [Aspergillus campestris IBT 28561]|uniref:4-hydroxyphenylpyruvate dioxygenase n=1 Tax=Aspergillus campestris (strain IBT 28561) TaxID=1392248 RepID=A0A2I1DGT2_ASPC2|nr:4-hydroxyphenylpyruvate dioxygenase 2 [Aspergillus campestris IBT 28561]PKY09078.1 4-hydroxyphenylpyruvate dioxygenase 2 [Aspergillus campestris IBT 28561]